MTSPGHVRTGFTCPLCGAHKDDPSITIDTDVVYERPLVRLWEGGPLVEDLGVEPEARPGERTLSTDACRCVFKLSEWDMVVDTYPATGAAVVNVTRREEP